VYTKHYAANNGGKSCFKVDAKSLNKGSFVLHAHVPMETSMYSDLFLASVVRAKCFPFCFHYLSLHIGLIFWICIRHNYVLRLQGKSLLLLLI